MMDDKKDTQLWQLANARAEFKTHLSVYLIINLLLWVIWFIISGFNSYPWPLWPTIGWGIGVIFNYLSVYRFNNTAEREYKKLKEKK